MVVFKSLSHWGTASVAFAASALLVITTVLTLAYMQSDRPDVHVVDHGLTEAGRARAPYMWIALTTIVSFFLQPTSASST